MLSNTHKHENAKFIKEINEYISKNIVLNDNIDKNIYQLLMLCNYITTNEKSTDAKIIIYLVKVHSIISDILDNILSNQSAIFKTQKYKKLAQNDLFISFIDAYCYINNIDNDIITNDNFNEEDENYYDVHNSDIVTDYLKQLQNITLLTADEERQLLIRKTNNDEYAKKELVERNLRLVVNIAKRYAHLGVPLMDLIQEGNIGLMTAVEKFDVSKENRFSTYAVWWIRQSITRTIATRGKIISIPVSATDQVNKYVKATRFLQDELGHHPSNKEIAEYMNKSESDILKIQKIQFDIVSLNAPLDEEHGSELGDLIADEESFEEKVFEKELHTLIMKMLNHVDFTPNEKFVLQLRNGINCDHPMTLDEIAKKIGITRERVRQIEAKGLRKIRSSSYLKLLAGYYDPSAKVENNNYGYCYSKNGF